MKAHLYNVFSNWNDEKLIAEYKKKNEYQELALDIMKQVLQERGLQAQAEQIDQDWLETVTIRQNTLLNRAQQSGTKERHWFVTTWFVLMLAFNAFVAWFNLYYLDILEQTINDTTSRKVVFLLLTMPFLNLIFVFGLFAYKRWAFYGFVFSAIVSFFMNVAMNGINIYAIIGLAGLFLLYGILQITKNGVTAWDYLD